MPASELEPGIAAVIDRCLRKDPNNRYQAMDELREDIEAVNDGREPRALHLASPTSDTYAPRGHFSVMVARALYRKLSVPMPRSFGA
jgi:serine/threonine protein kinase